MVRDVRQPMIERLRCGWCPEVGLHSGYPLRACDEHVGEIDALMRDARATLTFARGRLRVTEGMEETCRVRAALAVRDARGEAPSDGWVALGATEGAIG